MFTWETTSFFFSTLLAQEPLKKDQPLSTASRDPNGTLLTGLKAKRNVVKTFAFWELVIIAQKHTERRKAIFADIEREGGTTWSQMLNAALDVVQDITTRIEAATTKAKTPEASQDADAMEIDSLPRIAPPIKESPIYANSPQPQTRTQELESYIDWGAKRIGQSKRPFSPSVSKSKKLLKYVSPAGVSPDNITSTNFFKYAWSRLQTSPVGYFFRTPFSRKVNTTILGTPHSNAALIIDAIESIIRMQVSSLSEDIYGKVIQGVPTTVRAFTSTINAIETFVENDVLEEATQDADIEEVEVVLARLKAGLAELLSAFQLYLTDQGVSAAEHRQAQNAARRGRLLPERGERRRGEEEEKKKRLEQAKQKDVSAGHQRQNGNAIKGARKDGAAQEAMGNAREGGKEKEKGKDHGGVGRPKKRLEPQDPARKKLFQDIVPKSVGRREMEMVR